ncbi:30S ribosome-binding factor RbfA [Endozoicomonas sp. GU-1]|uniref:30S ribosome-binding factor RbfA n=1 Tax=Endozoicomonas sp. GU-1 TaxID=3009078 RepID=UPI0022B30D28|nr:30S ribosome-binding factor RbfA [Endozoicomonas sp. GU-1]WBA82300.1 30S ribosome-binding factor RbfA [Endozoicomonas sp. GU-1]WBA85236.1 30S ribosome-binding factor RbfA [Endozoicomonas sp. GU-1]
MAKEYSRTQRVADQIQKELAQLIQLEMKDPRLGMVTVSVVEVSRDLAFADVYVSFLGVDDQETIDQSLEILSQAAGFLRSQLARAIKLRFTPRLRFYYDNSLRRGAYLSSLIDQAVAKDAKADKGSEEGTEE